MNPPDIEDERLNGLKGEPFLNPEGQLIICIIKELLP